VDLKAVKAATGPELAACAVASAVNARGLLNDAQILAGSGCRARAYSLAALAVEECGKAAVMSGLAVMPQAMRAQAPVGRLLEWHQLKQVGGLLIAAVTYGFPGAAARLAAMNDAELAQILGTLEAPADEADRLKRRGLYVDMDRDGRIRQPSEITEAEVTTSLARAVQAVSSASALLDPPAQARMTNPPAEAVELAQAMVSALTETRDARTPKAAAEVMLKAVRRLRDRMAVIDADGRPKAGALSCRGAAGWSRANGR
jgi:AbiV family abortive infection protein